MKSDVRDGGARGLLKDMQVIAAAAGFQKNT
jgi:hypothetical protein